MATLQDYIDVFERFTKAKDRYCIEENGLVTRMSFDFTEDLVSFLKDLKDREAVVRCKNCRWGDRSRNGKGEEMILCYNGDTGIEDGFLHEPDWFCAEGERGSDDG